MENYIISRRSFFTRSLPELSIIAGILAVISACQASEEDDKAESTASGGDCSTNGTSTSIGANHGHELTIPAADVDAGAEKTYNIQGSGGHNHTVTITAAQFTSLQNNEGVSVSSSSASSHAHTITVNCA
jgi:hypothetical protein